MAGLEPIRFHTVTDEDEGRRRYGAYYDETAATTGLAMLREKGERERGIANNFPGFFGMNSAMYARRLTDRSTDRDDPMGATQQQLASVQQDLRRQRLLTTLQARMGSRT